MVFGVRFSCTESSKAVVDSVGAVGERGWKCVLCKHRPKANYSQRFTLYFMASVTLVSFFYCWSDEAGRITAGLQ